MSKLQVNKVAGVETADELRAKIPARTGWRGIARRPRTRAPARASTESSDEA
jgi:hypothetical protein